MPQSANIPAPPPNLLDQLRNVLRRKHLSLATEEAYVGWCRRFILFHDKKHPKDMGEVEIRAFLTDLAVTRRVAASTQNQALKALVFLYVHVSERMTAIPVIAIYNTTRRDHTGGRIRSQSFLRRCGQGLWGKIGEGSLRIAIGEVPRQTARPSRGRLPDDELPQVHRGVLLGGCPPPTQSDTSNGGRRSPSPGMVWEWDRLRVAWPKTENAGKSHRVIPL